MKKFFKKTVAIILSTALVLTANIPAFAMENNSDVYQNTKTYNTVEEIAELYNTNPQAKTFLDNIQNSNSDSELIGVKVQDVFVAETYDENGTVLDSRLLTNSEVKNLENGVSPAISWIDGSGQDYYKLSITLAAYDDGNYYRLYGGSSWSGYASSGNGEQNPSSNDDFIAVSWGGDLPCVSKTAYGVYSDNSSINLPRCLSNPTQGYIWQFAELSNGKYAKDVQANVTLEKSSNTTAETGAILTYIHTYGDTEITISGFTILNNIPVPMVTLSQNSDAWKTEVSVAGLLYEK